MRQWRNRIKFVASLLLVVVLLTGARIVTTIYAPERCEAWVCDGVRDGSISEWVARWIYWCDCSREVMTRAPGCKAQVPILAKR